MKVNRLIQSVVLNGNTAHLPLCACVLSCFSRVRLFTTPWTLAHQAPLSMGFSRQEYWSGLPCLQRCFIFVSVESLWIVARSLSHRQPWPSWMSSLQKLNCVDSSRSSPGCMRAEWYLISSSFRFQRGGL